MQAKRTENSGGYASGCDESGTRFVLVVKRKLRNARHHKQGKAWTLDHSRPLSPYQHQQSASISGTSRADQAWTWVLVGKARRATP